MRASPGRGGHGGVEDPLEGVPELCVCVWIYTCWYACIHLRACDCVCLRVCVRVPVVGTVGAEDTVYIIILLYYIYII